MCNLSLIFLNTHIPESYKDVYRKVKFEDNHKIQEENPNIKGYKSKIQDLNDE